MKTCAYCSTRPMYRDGESGVHLCPVHANLCATGPRGKMHRPPLTFRPATEADAEQIARLAGHGWGKGLRRFGHGYRVADLPAYVACADGEVVGVASYAREDRAVNLLAGAGNTTTPGFSGIPTRDESQLERRP